MKILKLCLALLLVSSIAGCTKQEETTTYDKSTFNYIEDLKTVSVDMFAYRGFDDADHVFRKLGFNESLRIFEEDATAIIYYGYPSCPTCTLVVSSMNEAAKNVDMQINYVDVSGETIGDDAMATFETLAQDHLYEEADGSRSFRVPLVMVVINGEIVASHIGALDGMGSDLSESEEQELTSFYEELFAPFK